MLSKPNLARVLLIEKKTAFDHKSKVTTKVIAIEDTIILRIEDDTQPKEVNGTLIEAEYVSKSGLSVGDTLVFDETGKAIEQISSKPKALEKKTQGCSTYRQHF